MTTRSVMKFIGGLCIVVSLLLFIEFVLVAIRDYQIDGGFFAFIGYSFIRYYVWIIPLGYFVFKDKDPTIKSKEVKR